MPERPSLAPVDSVDPEEWADAFAKYVQGAGYTRAGLIAWFASALETGRHYGVKKYLDLVSEQVIGQMTLHPQTASLNYPSD